MVNRVARNRWTELTSRASAVVQGHARPRVYLSNHSSCRHPPVPWLILGQWTHAHASRFAHLNVEGVTAAHRYQGTASPLASGMWREERIHRSFRARLVISEFTFYKQRSRWPSGRHLGSGQQMLHLLTRFARSFITSLYEVSQKYPPPPTNQSIIWITRVVKRAVVHGPFGG